MGKTDPAFERRAHDSLDSHPPCQQAQPGAPLEPADHRHFDNKSRAAFQLQKLLLIQTKTSVKEVCIQYKRWYGKGPIALIDRLLDKTGLLELPSSSDIAAPSYHAVASIALLRTKAKQQVHA